MSEVRKPLSPRRPLYYGWIIVGVTFVANIGLAPYTPVIFSFFVIPMTGDLGWSRSQLSLGLTVRYLASGVAAPFIGRFIDKRGARWLGVASGIIGTGVLLGLANVHSLWLFYLLWAAAGLAGIGGGPGGNLITQVTVAKWFTANRGRAMAIAIAGTSLGAMIALPIVSWFVEAHSWRMLWLIFAVVFFTLSVPWYAIFVRRSPEDLGLQPPQPRPGSSAAAAALKETANEVHWTLKQAVRTATFWQAVAAFSMVVFALSGNVLYRTPFWKEVGISPTLLGFGTLLDPFTTVLTAIGFGIVAERIGPRRLGMVGAGGYATGMMLLIFAVDSPYLFLAHNLVQGVASGALGAALNITWPTYFGRKFLGSIQGFVFLFTIFCSAVAPPIYGSLLDVGVNVRIVWTISLVLLTTAALLLVTNKRPSLARQAEIFERQGPAHA